MDKDDDGDDNKNEEYDEEEDEFYREIREYVEEEIVNKSITIRFAYDRFKDNLKDEISFKDFFTAVYPNVKWTQRQTFFNIQSDPQLEIPEEEKCKRCRVKRRTGFDVYCPVCKDELVQEASDVEDEIRKALKTDEEFGRFTNETGAVAYVKDKYRNKRRENNFIYLNQIAKEEYHLRKHAKDG